MKTNTYKICTTCIMDTTSPDIIFDENGVCNYCNTFKEKVKFENIGVENDNSLNQIVKTIKMESSKKNKPYDCLIAISGGMDSSYLAYYAVEFLKLKPLLFHVDAGWNSSISSNNIEKIVDKLGLDLITNVIDWEEIKDLQLAYFKSGVPSLDTIQDHAYFGAIYNFVEKENIKYILTGANFATEFIRAPLDWAYHASDTKQIRDIHNKFGQTTLKNFPLYDIFKSRFYLRFFKGVKIIYPLNYINYNKSEAQDTLKEKFEWQEYPKKHHESRFTAFYENYWSIRRFGHDRRKLIYSGMILSNQMTRKEALKLIAKEPIDEFTLKKEINYICDKLDITTDELNQFFKIEKKTFRDYKSNYFLIRFFTQILNFLNIEKRIF